MSNKQQFYGWYSKKQARTCRDFCIYRKDNGAEVVVTQISSTTNHNSNWDDMVMVGMVVDYVKSVHNPDCILMFKD